MRQSRYFIQTLREIPSEAEVVSHQLMLRASMIKKVAAGIYDYLPLGLKVIRKVENIIRENMNKAGAIELLMSVVQPAELWQSSGRWNHFGKELLRFKDRGNRDFCLGPTHEEVITDIVKSQVNSYKQMPVTLYQIQTKFRDEVRPRFGLMRGREFIMKDAYSFDIDDAGADVSYQKMYDAYKAIFTACGLAHKVVDADTGSIGGSFSHEFMVLAGTGEDTIISCNKCEYSANVEKAVVVDSGEKENAALKDMEEVATPNKHTALEVAEFLGVDIIHVPKTMIIRCEGVVVDGREEDIYVATTLDQDLQQKAEKILENSLKAAANRNVTQGAIVVLAKDGAIKALVGGVNYNKSQFNRAIQALRQPGSAFKPFVYLTALENGFEPDDEVNDTPINIQGWKPENDDKQYHGVVTLRQALAKSYNLATINLANAVGRGKIIKLARKMGITTPIENTPSMALGTFEVKVLDMAVAYASIANGGYAVWPYGIQEIFTRDGFQLYMRTPDDPEQILDSGAVDRLTDMMSDVINFGTGKNARLPFFAAGKTGTSQDYRDAWFVGFTDKYIAAVWVGNDDNSPMKGVVGGGLPARIWKQLMQDTNS